MYRHVTPTPTCAYQRRWLGPGMLHPPTVRRHRQHTERRKDSAHIGIPPAARLPWSSPTTAPHCPPPGQLFRLLVTYVFLNFSSSPSPIDTMLSAFRAASLRAPRAYPVSTSAHAHRTTPLDGAPSHIPRRHCRRHQGKRRHSNPHPSAIRTLADHVNS